MGKKWQAILMPGLAFFVLMVAYCWLLRPHIAGIWGDDAIYLIAGKALATGHGYTILSEPGLLPLIKYPPFYPLILAPIWWLTPHFPDNLIYFKLLNLVLSLGVLALLYLLAHRRYKLSPGLASALCLFVGLNFSWLSIVLDTMSEPLFTLLTLGTVYLAATQEALDKENNTKPISVARFLGITLLSCLAFYTRTLGIALIIGVTLWFWQKNKRQALIYLAACTLASLGWVSWCLDQPSTVVHLGNFYAYPYNQSYLTEYLMQIISQHGLDSMLIDAIQNYPQSILISILPVVSLVTDVLKSLPWLTWGLTTILWLALAGLGWAGFKQHRSSILFCCLIAFFPITIAWYSHDQYTRLLLSVLPIMALLPFQWLAQWPARFQKFKVSAVAALVLLNLASPLLWTLPRGEELVNNVPGLWDDYQATFRFIKEQIPPNEIVWAHEMFYLYTDRKTLNRHVVASLKAYMGLQSNEEFTQKANEAVYETMRREHVHYLVLEPHFSTTTAVNQIPDMTMLGIIRFNHDKFQRIYTSPQKRLGVYRVNL